MGLNLTLPSEQKRTLNTCTCSTSSIAAMGINSLLTDLLNVIFLKGANNRCK